MGAEEVHGAVERGGRIVLPDGLHAAAEVGGVPAAQPRQQRRPEGVVHQTVGLLPQQIAAAAGVGDLVAAVLPHLAQEVSVRLLLRDGGADGGDEVIGQLVRHVQTPAVGAAAQPAPYHGILIGDDEPPIVRRVLIHRRQRVDAPPRIVFRGPWVKAVPREVGGVLTLCRPRLRVKAVGVEIPAVGAGMVEYAVQNDADAPVVRLAA